MAPGPSPSILEDARFEDVFRKALADHGLSEGFAEPVRRLVTGTADPRTFVCCDSGCTPCAKDYLGAAEAVLKKLSKPEKPRRRRWFFF